ncbi:MAG: 4-alpha-glucanotransferase [Pseudomonadota bacterium]
MNRRRAGILLHPTSLPTHTFEDAGRWLDFLALCGISVWQMLPLGAPQDGRSPYQCNSAFATNPALLKTIPAVDQNDPGFADFCDSQHFWLQDYALFVTLRSRFQKPWYLWPDDYKFRDAAALDKVKRSHRKELQLIYWEQYQLFAAWQKIRRHAADSGVALFGDLPIFVAHDSADVWVWPELFQLDEAGMPTVVTGVPPDYFSSTGQRWGNPHYNWERMQQDGFNWWLKRLQHHYEWFDLVRFDHFRGLVAVWEIDAQCETAVDGIWRETPGEQLLTLLQQQMCELPLVAEDLGIITEDVIALKEKFHLPGMAVLQFSFDHFDDNPHKPLNIQPNTVCYTGTHDNDTTLGWYQAIDEHERQLVHDVLGVASGKQALDAMIATALNSRANLAMLPLQDCLALGTEARMNTPGTATNNWRWAFSWEQLNMPAMSRKIHAWLEDSSRIVT